jgi:hypothetical protein
MKEVSTAADAPAGLDRRWQVATQRQRRWDWAGEQPTKRCVLGLIERKVTTVSVKLAS